MFDGRFGQLALFCGDDGGTEAWVQSWVWTADWNEYQYNEQP